MNQKYFILKWREFFFHDSSFFQHKIGVILALLPCFVELALPSCELEVSCPCGETGSHYTFCLHNIPENEDVCGRWASCKKCNPEVDHCTRCPTGRVGPTCLQDCGRPFLGPDGKTTYDEPWSVAIAQTDTEVPRVECGGVLIDMSTVLTAAHCVSEPEFLELIFGQYHESTAEDDDDEKVEKRTNLTIRVHPDFHIRSSVNNIAVVKFSPPVQFSDRIHPVCLPTVKTTARNMHRGKKGYVAGWRSSSRGVLPETLFSVHLPVFPVAECIEGFQPQKLDESVAATMFCAGYKKGGRNVCAGHRGAPMVFFDRKRQRYTVEGLASYGTAGVCEAFGHFTVFSKVLPYLGWIFDNQL